MREKNDVTPMGREEAHKWVMEGDVELFKDVFGEPPEATAETQAPEATLYIRVPASLKERIEELAGEEALSLNSWSIRCLERCATNSRP